MSGVGVKFRLKLDDHGRGKAFVNDEEIRGVVSVVITAGVGSCNIVTLSVLAHDVEVDLGITDVTIAEKHHGID